MFISDFAIKKPIVTVVTMVALVAFGAYSLRNLQTDEFPDIAQPIVTVAVPYPGASPDVVESEAADPFRLISLDALIRMKLAAFRDKDRTHLRDLIDVGLLDAAMLDRLPAELRSRLETILQTPDGLNQEC